jgi:hypothetical protein
VKKRPPRRPLLAYRHRFCYPSRCLAALKLARTSIHRHPMPWSAILWSGFIASVLACALLWMLRSAGALRYNPVSLAGCLFLPDPNNPRTETLGLALVVAAGSTLVAVLYALIMPLVGGPGWDAGVVLGTVHGMVVVGVLPIAGTISACVRSGELPAPGPLGRMWGWSTPVGIVAGHVTYGAVLGAILAAFDPASLARTSVVGLG